MKTCQFHFVLTLTILHITHKIYACKQKPVKQFQQMMQNITLKNPPVSWQNSFARGRKNLL